MARKKKVVEQFVVGSALELYGNNLMSDAVSSSPEEAAQEAVDYEGDPSYVDGYIVFKLVPVARIAAPANPQFTLEPIS